MTELIRILIADDHLSVRQGLAALLVARNGMTVIGEAATGQEAIELARTLRPDVTLIEMILPDMTGPTVISRIKADNPEARILVLTHFDDSQSVSAALQAGASGYLLIDSGPDVLFQAIRKVQGGHMFFPELGSTADRSPAQSCGRDS